MNWVTTDKTVPDFVNFIANGLKTEENYAKFYPFRATSPSIYVKIILSKQVEMKFWVK